LGFDGVARKTGSMARVEILRNPWIAIESTCSFMCADGGFAPSPSGAVAIDVGLSGKPASISSALI
jgi:hypothetical protein